MMTATSQEPGPARPTDNRSARVVLWIIVTVVAVAIVGTALVAAALVVGSSDDDGGEEAGQIESGQAVDAPADEATAAPAETEQTVDAPADEATTAPAPPAETEQAVDPATDEATVAPAPAASTDNPEALLLAFGEAWRVGDWSAMATMASSDDVVTVAQQWYSEDGYPSISDENMKYILDTCFTNAGGNTECFFTYNPPEGFGLIFNISFVDNGNGLSVAELIFGGDAG